MIANSDDMLLPSWRTPTAREAVMQRRAVIKRRAAIVGALLYFPAMICVFTGRDPRHLATLLSTLLMVGFLSLDVSLTYLIPAPREPEVRP